MDSATFIKHCLSFAAVTEKPHFEKTSFRVDKKIFATHHIEKNSATLKLSEIDQSFFCVFYPDKIKPATGSWGKQGWTIFELTTLEDKMILDALNLSYCNVAIAKISEKKADINCLE